MDPLPESRGIFFALFAALGETRRQELEVGYLDAGEASQLVLMRLERWLVLLINLAILVLASLVQVSIRQAN